MKHTHLPWVEDLVQSLVSAASRVKRLESSHCDIFFPMPQIKNNEDSALSSGDLRGRIRCGAATS
jgi:hypothetical protein